MFVWDPLVSISRLKIRKKQSAARSTIHMTNLTQIVRLKHWYMAWNILSCTAVKYKGWDVSYCMRCIKKPEQFLFVSVKMVAEDTVMLLGHVE